MAHHPRPLPRRALALTITALVALPAPSAFAQATTRAPGRRPEDRALLQLLRRTCQWRTAALATERYLSSYGTPQPSPTSSTVTVDAGPTWTAAVIVGTLLSVVSAGIGVAAGRASARPRHVTA